MRYYEKCVRKLAVERNGSKHDSCETANQKNKEEAKDKQDWDTEIQLAVPQGCRPAEKLSGCGNHNHQGSGGKKTAADHRDRRGKHVMHPHAETHEAGSDSGEHQHRVAEIVAARKIRNQR